MKPYKCDLRLSENEYKRLTAKLEMTGLTKSQLMRKYINDEPIIDKDLYKAIIKLDIDMSRIGNNINQIAHQWHASGSDWHDIAYIEKRMDELYDLISEVKNYCYNSHRSERK